MEKSLEPPPTNRGVENTLNTFENLIYKGKINNLGQFILFDWIQFTILEDYYSVLDDKGVFIYYRDIKDSAFELFEKFFGIGYSDLFFEYKGINGYNASISYKNIYCYYNVNRPDMGIHFKLSGQGCRDFEELNLDYITLFKNIYKFSFNFNRIDISIDDFTDKYFTLPGLLKYCKKGRVSSRFKSCLNIEKMSLSSTNNLGHTLQFGSKSSNIQITFYDKIKERISQGYVVENHIKFWTRTELRFRHESADLIICTILKDSSNINTIVKSILSEYIDFKNLSSNDSNISRISSALFWTDFLENVDSLKLNKYLPESSITKKANWLKNSVSKTNFMVYISQLDNLSVDEITSDYLLNFLNYGSDKFCYKDLLTINDYRRSHKLEPFTFDQVIDYINDIKEVALLLDKKD